MPFYAESWWEYYIMPYIDGSSYEKCFLCKKDIRGIPIVITAPFKYTGTIYFHKQCFEKNFIFRIEGMPRLGYCPVCNVFAPEDETEEWLYIKKFLHRDIYIHKDCFHKYFMPYHSQKLEVNPPPRYTTDELPSFSRTFDEFLNHTHRIPYQIYSDRIHTGITICDDIFTDEYDFSGHSVWENNVSISYDDTPRCHSEYCDMALKNTLWQKIKRKLVNIYRTIYWKIKLRRY